MADKTIGDLNNAPGTVDDSNTLFVVQQAGAAYKLDGHAFILALTTILDGHGGVSSVVYTPPVAPSLTGTMVITLADQSTTTVSIQNGKGITSIAKASTSGLVDTYRITYNDNTTSTFTVTNGAKGDTGQAWYVWIRYAGQQPTSDADIGTTPDNWMGIYSGTASTAPTHYTQYQWFQIKGEKGDTGNTGASIASVTRTGGTGDPGSTDTYTITLDNGTVAGTFTVYNGLNGTGAVSTVNGVQPDISGNVAISAANIPTSGASDVQSDITSLTSLVSTAQSTANSKAPINHASASTNYGVGNYSNYGHVKLTDTPSASMQAGDGYAATPAAVQSAIDQSKWELLWQNASPTSTFGPQTITLSEDSHNYDYLVFDVRNGGGIQYIGSTAFDGAEYQLAELGYVTSDNVVAIRSRQVYITNASVRFGDNRQATFASANTTLSVATRNDINQPLAIYGVNI